MREYGFSLTHIFPYKDRTYDSVLMRESTGKRKPVFWHNLHSSYSISFYVLPLMRPLWFTVYIEMLRIIASRSRR